MQIRNHHHTIILRQLLRRQLQRHTYLIVIMDIAIEEDCEHQDEDTQGHLPVVEEPRTGYQMNESSKVEYQEDDHQIEHDKD